MSERRRIALSAEARLDLRSSRDFYESKQPGLGKRFMSEVVDTLTAISERPNSFPVAMRNTRRAIVKIFSHGVFFRDRQSHLEIVAIVDLRRHPRVWRRRK